MKFKKTTLITSNTFKAGEQADFNNVVFHNYLHIKLHHLHKKEMIVLIV